MPAAVAANPWRYLKPLRRAAYTGFLQGRRLMERNTMWRVSFLWQREISKGVCSSRLRVIFREQRVIVQTNTLFIGLLNCTLMPAMPTPLVSLMIISMRDIMSCIVIAACRCVPFPIDAHAPITSVLPHPPSTAYNTDRRRRVCL